MVAGGRKNMIHVNLSVLRKRSGMTQEQVAERLGVSRQALAKWERGESVPDMDHCAALAKLFSVSIDDLVNYSEGESGLGIPPKGKHFFGMVTVGERGQIVIPKEARELFRIRPGDKLLCFGDEDRGLGIVPCRALETLMELMEHGFSEKKEEPYDRES